MARNIIFYRTESGMCPVEKFLDSLQPKVVQKVSWVLKLIQEIDLVPSQYFKKLIGTEDLWECRISIQSSAYRIFSFFSESNTLVLTNGYSKKSQKIDRTQIKLAEAYRRDFLDRKRRPS